MVRQSSDCGWVEKRTLYTFLLCPSNPSPAPPTPLQPLASPPSKLCPPRTPCTLSAPLSKAASISSWSANNARFNSFPITFHIFQNTTYIILILNFTNIKFLIKCPYELYQKTRHLCLSDPLNHISVRIETGPVSVASYAMHGWCRVSAYALILLNLLAGSLHIFRMHARI